MGDVSSESTVASELMDVLVPGQHVSTGEFDVIATGQSLQRHVVAFAERDASSQLLAVPGQSLALIAMVVEAPRPNRQFLLSSTEPSSTRSPTKPGNHSVIASSPPGRSMWK